MRPRLILMLACLWTVSGCALLQPRRNPNVPAPAKTVDLTRYLGTWHELARYDSSFEHGCGKTIAVYTARPDGLIGVENRCWRHGHWTGVKGRAYVVAHSGNAKLKISFFGPFFLGNYWVLDHADDYSWSIVGEPSGGYLWLLTRDPVVPASLRDRLAARAQALGYDISPLVFTPG